MKRLISMIISIILMITPSLAEEGTEKSRTVRDLTEELAKPAFLRFPPTYPA